MKQLKGLILILFMLLVVVLSVQNYAALSTKISFRAHLLFFNFETSGLSVFFIAVITFLVGVVLTCLYSMSERLGFKRQLRTLTKEVKDNENELNSLRNLPVTTEDMNTGDMSSPPAPTVSSS